MAIDKKAMPGMHYLEGNLNNLYARWNDILINGCRDPFVPDGANMQKIRRQIIRISRQMSKLYPRENCLRPCGCLPPPSVRETYMARSAEIRMNAKKTLWILRNSKNYIYINQNCARLPEKEQETKHYIENIMRDIQKLADDIEEDNLLNLRRNGPPDELIFRLKTAADRLKRAHNKSTVI